MSYRSGVVTGAATVALLAGAAAAGYWLWNEKPGTGGKTPPPGIPATVAKVFQEQDAAGVVLTAEAEARLAIRLAPVERKSVGRVRVYGAEVTIPPGQAVVVSAPLAGVLKLAGKAAPVAGQPVKQNDVIYQLLPILDPVGRANLTTAKVDADGLVKAAEEQQKLAQIALDRAKNVLAKGAGSQRVVDEAQAQMEISSRNLEAQKLKLKELIDVVGQAEAGTTAPMPIKVPENGVLRVVSALPGQSIPAGALLFEVVDLSHVWVRVPVYVGDLADVDAGANATIGTLTARPGELTKPATPVPAPPAANPIAGTADLYYALDNRETNYRPGQRIGATLALRGPAEALVIPWMAVVYDIHGGAWVYEKVKEQSYSRRRVVVRYIQNDIAVLASGPAPGTVLVIAGAAELFGTETGFSK